MRTSNEADVSFCKGVLAVGDEFGYVEAQLTREQIKQLVACLAAYIYSTGGPDAFRELTEAVFAAGADRACEPPAT